MKGSLKDLNEIPPCGLVDAFARNIGTVPETLHQTFLEGLRQRLPKGIPNQDQYQEAVSGKQDQKLSALRAVAPTENIPSVSNTRIETIARVVLSDSPKNADLNYLVDAVIQACHLGGIKDCNRKQVLVALGNVGVRVA
jgi:hypothetical protein